MFDEDCREKERDELAPPGVVDWLLPLQCPRGGLRTDSALFLIGHIEACKARAALKEAA